MSSGWIKLHRQLQDCCIWHMDEPFDKRSAWVDLLLSANHTDTKIVSGGKTITVKRGQYLTSIRKLAERWMWSVNKTYRYINLLETEHMVRKESDNDRTLLTIENYGFYQYSENTDRTQVRTPTNTPTNTPDRTLETVENKGFDGTPQNTSQNTERDEIRTQDRTHIKNIKNKRIKDNNISSQKHRYGEYQHVLLTDAQLDKLYADFGQDETNEAIRYLDEYIEMKGYQAKNHNLAIRKWVFRALEREKSYQEPQKPVSKNRFHNFDQAGYDYDAIVKDLNS